MGSSHYREQFTFVAGQLDRFVFAQPGRRGHRLSWTGCVPGFHNLVVLITLAEFRKVFHGPLIGNCGYTKETAEQAIAAGHADLISFGRPFISNPDLVERFRNGWPRADPMPLSDSSWPREGRDTRISRPTPSPPPRVNARTSRGSGAARQADGPRGVVFCRVKGARELPD